MKRSTVLFLLLSLAGPLRAVPTPIDTILADTSNPGMAGDDIYIWGPGGATSVSLDSTTVNPAPPEGFHSMKSTVISGQGSTWAIMYLNAPDQNKNRSNRPVDLSAYANGEIRFWANCDRDDFEVFIQHADGSQDGYGLTGAFQGNFNQWVPVILPLGPITSSYAINDIVSPFLITANHNLTCYIDDVRYVNPQEGPYTSVFNATVKNISDGSATGGSVISWNGVSPTGWVRADQYVDLELDDVSDLRSWGVQIYTNNTSGSASPKYVVSGTSNPAGLVDVGSPDSTLPMAWSITAGTQSALAASPVPADPNNFPPDPLAFPWVYMKDAATPDIPSENTTAFQNGELYVTLKNHTGIHYGAVDLSSDANFGASNSPNYIFFEANFGKALAQRNYQTNSLIIEFYTL